MNKPNGSLSVSVLCSQTGLQEYTDYLNLQYLKPILNKNLCNKFLSYFCFQITPLHSYGWVFNGKVCRKRVENREMWQESPNSLGNLLKISFVKWISFYCNLYLNWKFLYFLVRWWRQEQHMASKESWCCLALAAMLSLCGMWIKLVFGLASDFFLSFV